MRKALIFAVVFVFVGAILFTVALAAGGWDIRNLGSPKYETNEYEIVENVENISVKSDTTDVRFLPSVDEKIRVVCYENTKIKNVISVVDGILKIEPQDTRKWYDHISFFDFSSPDITVYLPEREYGALSVKISTGDVKIKSGSSFESIDLSGSTSDVECGDCVKGLLDIKVSTGDVDLCALDAGEIKVKTSTGDIDFENVSCASSIYVESDTGEAEFSSVRCNDFTRKADTGDTELEDVIAKGKFTFNQDTGDVKFDRCDASEIYVKTSTGDVKGSFLTDKVVYADTSTGKKDVPKSTSGGMCEIKTSTGNIIIKIVK